MKGATTASGTDRVVPDISIHAPVKGATTLYARSHVVIPDFNPRSREGSDLWLLALSTFSPISIHAPVKGATIPLPMYPRV